jgi:hypothetical protein
LEIEEEEKLIERDKEKRKGVGDYVQRGLYDSSLRIQFEKEMDKKKDRELRKINARRSHLSKIKKFKWLFSRVD